MPLNSYYEKSENSALEEFKNLRNWYQSKTLQQDLVSVFHEFAFILRSNLVKYQVNNHMNRLSKPNTSPMVCLSVLAWTKTNARED